MRTTPLMLRSDNGVQESTCEKRSLNLGSRAVDVEVYLPATLGPAPGILLLHELYGLRDWYRDDAKDLAERGYLVYVPNLYTDGAVRYCIRAMVYESGRKNRSSSALNQEVHAMLDALKADPRCSGSLGMLGACLTGGFVLHMAQRPDMLAPVLFHHSFGLEGAGVPNDESLDGINRLQGHWAKKDVFCPARRRERLLSILGDRVEAYVYDMPHGFRSLSRGRPESKQVWERTLAFFERHLIAETAATDPERSEG